jgi:NADPH:quinone reductase
VGADDVIRYTEVSFADEVARLPDGHGVGAVYDGVGLATFDGDLASLARRGCWRSPAKQAAGSLCSKRPG